MGLEDLFIDVKSLPEGGYGFVQLLTLGAFYSYTLCFASNLISDGSELLLLVPSAAGLVGSVVLPVLGAVPDGCIVLFSGLGPNAAEQLDVGIGALAGSTIMLLTIPWFLSVLGGRVNIDQVTKLAKYKAPKLTPADRLSLRGTGVAISPNVNVGSNLMLITSIAYILIQVPAFVYSNATPEVRAKGTAVWALSALIASAGMFLWYLYYQYTLTDDLKEAKKEEILVKAITDGKITLLGVMYYELKSEFGDEKNLFNLYPGREIDAAQTPAAAEEPVAGFFNSFVATLTAPFRSDDLESAPLAGRGSLARSYSDKKVSQTAISRLRNILKPFFKRYDKDGSGSLEISELVAVFHDLGETVDQKALEPVFHRMDKDNSGTVDFEEFVIGVADYAVNSQNFRSHAKRVTLTPGAGEDVENLLGSARKAEEAGGAGSGASEAEVEEEEDVPADLAELSPEEQQRQIKFRSFWMMGLGTLIVVLISDPMVNVLSEIGARTGVSAFYVSFILAPLASNASEVIASYKYALKKTTTSISISLTALEGACVMNNTFVMCIFMLIVYAKNLEWKYSAETASILFVICAVAAMAQKRAHTIFDALLILSLYPTSLLLVAYLEYLGWQ